MKIKLSYKFFTAFLITCLIVTALLTGIMQFFVYRNFKDYVNKVEFEKLNNLISILSEEYQKHQGWESLRDNPRRWHDMLRDNLPGDNKRHPMPPPHHRPELPAPRFFEEDREHPHEPPRPPPPPINGIVQRLSLFDAEKKLVFGNPVLKKQIFKEIRADGKLIGWLGLKTAENLSNPLDIEFLTQQTRALYLIGFGILVLAGTVSFFLSRHLLAPVRQLTKGTQALTSFKFDTKIKVHTCDELGQLAEDFNQMAETLKKYEEMRQQWISDISHELRTPLSILRGEIEAVQDGIREINKETLNSLHSEVLHLSRLVDDLRLLSQADSQNLWLKKEAVNPVLILKKTLNYFAAKFERMNIQVQADFTDYAHIISEGDKDRLTQLFSNLLENTLRYTDSPGKLKTYYICSEKKLTIYFEDTPPGVPYEALNRIFDRLYRVDKSRSRAMGGSGLGLSICRQIAEAHGGSIKADHGASGGLMLIIELPIILSENFGRKVFQ